MLKFLPKFKNSSGITIIELLIVIALISTLGVMSISYYSNFLTQNSQDNTTYRLLQSLRKAQMYSMTGRGNQNWGVRYDSPQKKITLYQNGTSAFDESFTINSNTTAITSFSNVLFDRITGKPSSNQTIFVTGIGLSHTIRVINPGLIHRTF